MKYPHWQHFLALEKDFETIAFVELHSDNRKTFSIAYTKLLLSLGSEVDVVAKVLCNTLHPSSSPQNMDQYRDIITVKWSDFPTVEALVPRYGLTLRPWEAWSHNRNPQWWTNHNKVKHERNINGGLANQENTLEAVAGLFCMLLYVYQPEFYAGELSPEPSLLGYEDMPCGLLINPGAKLPGIPR